MSEPTMGTLTKRLDRLERENRRFKKAGMATLAVITAVVLMGQATAKKAINIFMSEEFVLRDTSGKIRGVLSVVEDEPYLTLYDKDKKIRFAVRAAADKVSLVVKGKDQKSGVRLTVAGGSTKLLINDKDGNPRTEIGLKSDGSPFLRLYDKGRKLRAGLGVGGDGSVVLLLADKEKGHAELTVQRGGLPRLRFVDKDVKGHIGLSRTDLGVALLLADKDGKAVWSLP